LAEAAAVAGYAAKPLPLFYALSQAGRAIAASRLARTWRLQGHGLTVRDQAEGVLASKVEQNGGQNASFPAVAAALGSAGLAGSCELGALWAANPDLAGVTIEGWPTALRVDLGARSLGRPFDDTPAQDPESTPTSTGGMVSVSVPVEGETAAEVNISLAAYPTLRNAVPYGSIPGGSGPVDDLSERVVRFNDQVGNSLVNVGVTADDTMTLANYWRRQDEMCSFVETSNTMPHHATGYVLPEIVGGPSPLPLLLWWGLLLGLSSFARYEPAAWTAAIDPSTSRLAVSLERALDLAETEVPNRILSALRHT
jgi:YaaC-like protein